MAVKVAKSEIKGVLDTDLTKKDMINIFYDLQREVREIKNRT